LKYTHQCYRQLWLDSDHHESKVQSSEQNREKCGGSDINWKTCCGVPANLTYPLHTTVLICLSSDSWDMKRSIHQLLNASTTLLGWGSSSMSGVGHVSVIRLYRIVQVHGLPEESRSRLLLSSLQSLIINVFVLLVQNLTKGPPWLIRKTNHNAAHPSPSANAATRHAPIIQHADTHYRTQLAHSAPSPPSQTVRPPRSSPLITSPSSTTWQPHVCPPLDLYLPDNMPIPIIRHAMPITNSTAPFCSIPIANSVTTTIITLDYIPINSNVTAGPVPTARHAPTTWCASVIWCAHAHHPTCAHQMAIYLLYHPMNFSHLL